MLNIVNIDAIRSDHAQFFTINIVCRLMLRWWDQIRGNGNTPQYEGILKFRYLVSDVTYQRNGIIEIGLACIEANIKYVT